jgi:hypothetical protein
MLNRFGVGTTYVLLLHCVALAQSSPAEPARSARRAAQAGVTSRAAHSSNSTPPQAPTAGGQAPAPIVDFDRARRESVLHAVRIDTPIVMDGRLDEPAWQLARPAISFIQVQPHHALTAIEQTEVRILYDTNNLYVGAMCFDSQPRSIRISSMQKDFSSNNTDLFAMVLDTLNEGHGGFSFWTNPAGARRDTQIDQDGERTDAEWDGVWDVRTRIVDNGWVAEFVIPFKTLRFPEAPTQDFGLNMVRRTRRTNEDSTWTPLPLRITSITRTPFAGKLTGFEGIRQGRNLKVKPFGIGSFAQSGVAGTKKGDGDAGLDVKYGITPKLTFDATFRTDFSQVEADEQQVNLTRFNILFPEKREFFLENSGLFQIASTPEETANILPFFSRRIGLSAAGTPIPMLGGTRLSGRARDFDIGALVMKTRDDGEEGTTGLVPSNNFLVGRIRRDLLGLHSVGVILTSRDSSRADDYSRTYGADMRLRFFKRRLDIASYVLGSDSPTDRGRGHTAKLVGAAWRDDHLKVLAQYEKVDPDFRPEVGFVRRSSMTHVDSEVSWTQQMLASTWMRNWSGTARVDNYDGPTGDVESRAQTANGGIEFQNGGAISAGIVNAFERLARPFALRPTVVLPVGDYEFLRYTMTGNTDLSRAISGSVNASAGDFWSGTSKAVAGTVTYRPNHHFNVAATFNTTAAKLPQGDFTATVIGTRFQIGFSPRMSLGSFAQYNSTTKQFTSNTRFNFLHHPLSDLFVVYNERRDTTSHALLDRALIVKFTNLFDF